MTDLPIEGGDFNVGAFLTGAIEEGLSARQALIRFREAGMRMSNESFRQLYAETRDIIGDRDYLAALDYDAIPEGEQLGTWAMGEGGQFATFVTSFVRRVGERELEQRYYTFITDEPHTAADAIAAAQDFYTDEALVGDSFGGGVYQGSVVTSMTQTRAR